MVKYSPLLLAATPLITSANSLRRLQNTTSIASLQCEPCQCSAPAGNATEKIKLRFLVADRSFAQLKVMMDEMAEDYTRKLGEENAPQITVIGLPTLSEVEREVKFDVYSGASQFDGYIITPLWIGDLAEGLFETSQFIRDYSNTEEGGGWWTDILLFYRDVISRYDGGLYLFPFDGDVISMFYRRDLLEKYNKDVPKTWDEYNELAAFFHGKTDTIDYENGTSVDVTLSGSCIGRMPECGNPYWAQTVLATLTQREGTHEGSMLDPTNLDPLLGPAMEETLRLLGEQTKYGVEDEFDGCVGVHVDAMNRGECVLTYNWGNSFSDHVREGSTVRGKLGVAPTPGSPLVLNRETGELEECTAKTCPYAVYDEKSGKYINQSPYGAYGGFSGAVSGSVSEAHQKAAAEFFAFATSAKKAIKYVIPNANNPDANPVPTGMDPYAKSMLNVEEWTSRGFDLKSTEEYKYAIESQLGSSNVVIDLRMPEAATFMSTLDAVTTQYCNDIKYDQFDKDPAIVRAELAEQLASEWRDIVTEYDSTEGREEGALLELYQRDRGVYKPPKAELAGEQQSNEAIPAGVVAAIIIITAVVVLGLVQFMSKKKEDIWYVDPNDIHDTKEVLGRGSFGVVTKGFLRGTPVALKHAKGWEPDLPFVKDVTAAEEAGPYQNNMRASYYTETNVGIDDSTVGVSLFASTTANNKSGCPLFFGKDSTNSADESLRSELLLLVKLRHDNIVQTLGASQDTTKKQLVLILQYMENGPIRNILKDPNGVAETAGMSLEIQWALQVARGLNFLHTTPPPNGPMVHADLKSSNVLLDSSYNANISDFGLAMTTMKGLWGAIQRSTKSNNPRGSILWMAPEVLNGADPTPESDVYSYSMFLVELMTRDRPYCIRAYEPKETEKDGKRMSEFSVDTEFERKPLWERRLSELSDDEDAVKEVDEAKPIVDEGKAVINSRRVSWSVTVNEKDDANTHTSDEASATVSETEESKKTKATSSGKFKAGKRDFYTIINGMTLSRDDVVARVKDLTLDPPFRPVLPDNAPQVLVDICTECWQKNPLRRPTMQEVEERLTSAVSSSSLMKQLIRRGSMFDSIIPPDVQDQLSKGETVKPISYDNVTVIFSDIVGFTSISSALTAEEVGDLIFRLFTQFDTLTKANGVKKLDVIGDAFLGVTGVPNAMPDHANRAAKFALEAIKAAQNTLICPAKPQLGYVSVRFGLASGSVVATVIGSREHPKYTLFGDTVNTASRMESSSSPNKCQCTEDTAKLIRSQVGGSGLVLKSRGMKEVKGKGTMETFFVSQSGERDDEADGMLGPSPMRTFAPISNGMARPIPNENSRNIPPTPSTGRVRRASTSEIEHSSFRSAASEVESLMSDIESIESA